MPERISNSGLNQTYYIDDVFLSNDPTPSNSTITMGVNESDFKPISVKKMNGGFEVYSTEPGFKVELSDTSGKILIAKKTESTSCFVNVMLKGMYVLKISYKNKILAQKIII